MKLNHTIRVISNINLWFIVAVLVACKATASVIEATSPTSEPEPTATPEPTDTTEPTATSEPTDTPQPTETPTSTPNPLVGYFALEEGWSIVAETGEVAEMQGPVFEEGLASAWQLQIATPDFPDVEQWLALLEYEDGTAADAAYAQYKGLAADTNRRSVYDEQMWYAHDSASGTELVTVEKACHLLVYTLGIGPNADLTSYGFGSALQNIKRNTTNNVINNLCP